jgi:hypothetical protein
MYSRRNSQSDNIRAQCVAVLSSHPISAIELSAPKTTSFPERSPSAVSQVAAALRERLAVCINEGGRGGAGNR